MFSKPASFKPSAAIKNSERKNVLAKIEKQCGIQDVTLEEKQLLLSKSVQAANALSHGKDKVVVYSDNQLPIWILYKSQYIPTVALLARLPLEQQLMLLPAVYTVPRTVQFLQNGADFMVPGIFGDLPSGPIKPGTCVQIRDLESQSVMATGIALRDLSEIKKSDSGKCIQTVSVVGDKLTPKTHLGKPFASAGSDEQKEPRIDSSARIAVLEPEAKPKVESAVPGNAAPEEKLPEVENLSVAVTVEGDDKVEEAQEDLVLKEVDEAFMYAVNKVIRQPRHTYPMTMSGFATLLTENMPYEHSQLNIRNTSFKKMGKLLKHSEKMGLVTCRDRQGGETIVTGVNVPQNEIEPEIPIRKNKKQASAADRMSALLSYKPKPSLRRIMDPELAKLDLHDAGSLRKQILNYITKENLFYEGHEINVNEPLRDALGLRQNVPTIKREDVGPLVVKQCSPFHKIVGPEQKSEEVNWTKGSVPSITLKTERRGGNKMVTLVHTSGLSSFKISANELADELRHVCAGSSTVTDVKGTNCIVVQGSHIPKIVKVLEKRGVEPAWIKGA